jgi:hypothetical protein
MRLLHRWTVGKQLAEPHFNEDAAACSQLKGIYAVSDGASESFDSRRWSRLLVARYIRNPQIDGRWLARAIILYNRAFDRNALSWSAQAAFDRGSFATLLGIRLNSDLHGVSILSIGDSLAVLDNGHGISATFPYAEPEQFRQNPLLLSTVHALNQSILQVPIATFSAQWNIAGMARPKLFCMTDAIGAWLLSARDERMQQLRELQSRTEFIKMVEGARTEGTMRRDDTTLLIIG